ncbi:hypothetical protein [Curvivirga aplysinae]|uniref:hypothetical protein n=1 Tax=Curvivirga aplysinae TaxID=2529852 RepID=UPI0012BB9FFB|nr:hypothetical protein [Curvivirga aplysinae]MTI09115.1 hypothetical protein [Curvivirga aplysinae]
MKSVLIKLSLFVIAVFTISACQTASYIQDRPLLLSNGAASHFVKFLEDKSASEFYIDTLGYYSVYYYCKDTNCRAGLRNQNIAACERDSGSECGLLATKHSIHWKNVGNFMPFQSEIVFQTYGDYFYDGKITKKSSRDISDIKGKGPIQLSNYVAQKLANFADQFGREIDFYVTVDGKHGYSSTTNNRFVALAKCKQASENKECYLLATRNKIVWNEPGNFMPAKLKAIKDAYGDFYFDK